MWAGIGEGHTAAVECKAPSERWLSQKVVKVLNDFKAERTRNEANEGTVQRPSEPIFGVNRGTDAITSRYRVWATPSTRSGWNGVFTVT